SLVLKTGGVGENGCLYLLDMGEPVRIRDLAEQLIRFHGYEPDTEIKIEYIGLRPGERLDETLISKDEEQTETEYDRILKVTKKIQFVIDTKKLVDDLRPICKFDPAKPKVYRSIEILRTVLDDYGMLESNKSVKNFHHEPHEQTRTKKDLSLTLISA
ncbi:MAG: polysaccharide biosynthesis protein, partial [Spirochaetes bacterium]|nr:polysaccharide biosynthesis protein [Spirochaetota bacterium]